MPFRKLFWGLSALLIAFIALQVLGYSVLDIIIALFLLDIVIVEISRQKDKNYMDSQLKPELLARIGNVEKLCSNILCSINAMPTIEHFCNVAEGRIEEHGTRLKEDIKDDLDRLAKKALDIENRLFEFRKSVTSGIENLDDRLRSLETGKWTVSSDDEAEEVEIEEEKAESPVLEEVVYGEGATIME